ncbi:MAG: cytochrome c oxidase subunit II [Vulcanimicrobiota bacterium]
MSWMPQNIATYGGQIDDLTVTITVITMVCLLLAEAFLLLAVFRFRRKAGQRAQGIRGEGWGQLKWVFLPVLAVVFLDLYIDVKNTSAWLEIKETLPPQGMVVGITGEQFMWSFRYPGPDGQLNTNDDIPASELHIPTATNVTFELTAKDVLHSLWIPTMRLKQDALPGRIEKGWMQATAVGTFDIACAEICGDGHSKMAAKLVVQSQSEFDAWLASAQANPQPTNAQDLIRVKGCVGCHSTDGSPMVGPSWKGIFGRTETVVSNGSEHQVEVDEDYLRRAILSPTADVVKGFPPVMPEMRDKLSDEQVTMIIQYLKTL